MSPAARLMSGITLLTVPTIVFGGLTVLGVITHGAAGLPGPELSATDPLPQGLERELALAQVPGCYGHQK